MRIQVIKYCSKLLSTVLVVANIFTTQAQQVADTLFDPRVARPAYPNNDGPVILIDEGHGNFHTAGGRFKPFADLLRRDGYTVNAFDKEFSRESLSACRILVVANALHDDNQGRWSLPTPSAFTTDEIAEVNEWVREGGSLFLIADHMPFPGAAESLALSFGIKFYNGFAMRKGRNGRDIFKEGDGLQQTILTRGRHAEESISSLRTFTGQAFELPPGATAVIVLNDDFEMLMPQTAWQFDKETKKLPATGLVQGAFMQYGEGRVVIFGEAAMFTAQVQGKRKVGMNSPDAGANAQFALNVIHWLDHLLN